MADHRLLRLKEVLTRTGISRATVYRLIARGEFPRPTHVTPHASRWVDREIDAWIDDRVIDRDMA
ncbi:AlpA family transcriptional regulator [Minwuia thermotolerans]|uniref:AlpA family transcriptional regulator n=2 Tax=Minwuia thermotolerans TaxID=2056226 RepID=A0A2M9FY20_9PROT|nr:AlpA family transcriptional regulator [Minwuia thermotolerans]